ncbi:agmatine deiminase family protein [Seonamhaeicola aphaedonensis]|uniref:Agmatine deiminase n=1 Tax=Seonamhaeicola aphaedonensis TaxID=1461338 RepID=A0A3D9HJ30_9FLAO|nr:agmatine deiminase family protein [Seonamhaeicola aphaedonensis]RED49463.1 agmatine deiminase [Seonamhaeicola aphaedonensis]
MKTKNIVLVCLVLAASFTLYFTSNYQDYQASTDFDETDSHLVVWSKNNSKTYLSFLKNLAENEHVILFIPRSISSKDMVFKELKSFGVNTDNVQLETITNENIWIRDFGPLFLMNKCGNTKSLSFKYHERKTHTFPYEYQHITKEKIRSSQIVGIGGARELNGKGLAILLEKHEEAANPKLTKNQIAKELKKVGVKKIIWLKSGLPQDEKPSETPIFENIYTSGAGHHIDAFCRFISPNTVLLAQVNSNEINANPIMKIAHERLEENYNILKNASDQDGNPLNIIRVPVAPLLFENEIDFGDMTRVFLRSTSYLNFIITKDKVIVPGYAESIKSEDAITKDSEIKIIYKSIFPEKKIILLGCVDLNRNGGGFHCIAINKPKKKKKVA